MGFLARLRERMFPAPQPVFLMDGPETDNIFTYVPEALKGVKVRTPFTVDLLDKGVRIQSTVTGGEWDSDVDGGIPVSYNGRVFGFTSRCDRFVKSLQAEGVKVQATARIRKWNRAEGFPYVEISVPDYADQREYVDTFEVFGPGFASLGHELVRIPAYMLSLPDGYVGRVSFSMAEPVGSKKPEVVALVDGAEAGRAGARFGYYSEMCRLAEPGREYIFKHDTRNYKNGNSCSYLYIIV